MLTPRGDGVISLQESYAEIEFEAKQEIKNAFANGTDLCVVNLGPILSISELKKMVKLIMYV